MHSYMVYQIALAYISAGFSFSHHVIYIFYAVEVHVIITEGIVGFDSDISYSSTHTEGYVTVEPVFQVDLSCFVPHWVWQNKNMTDG